MMTILLTTANQNVSLSARHFKKMRLSVKGGMEINIGDGACFPMNAGTLPSNNFRKQR